MNYPAVLLLVLFPPYKAFKLLCNLILTRRCFYKAYRFKPGYLRHAAAALEAIVARFHPRVHKLLSLARFELWGVFWVEWVYGVFLRTFDLKVSLRLWDLMLARGEIIFFRLCLVIFGLLEDNLDSLAKDNFFDSAKRFILGNQGLILEQLANEAWLEAEQAQVAKIFEKERLN